MSRTPVPPPDRTSAQDPAWTRAMVDLHYRHSPLALVSGMVFAAMAVVILMTPANAVWLRRWLVLSEIAMAARLLVTLYFLHGQGAGRIGPQVWKRIAQVQSVISGLAWGSLGLFHGQLDSATQRTALMFTLMGVCAGSAALVGSIRGTLPLFGALTLGPLVAQLMIHGDTAERYMAAALGYYIYLVMFKGPSRISHSMEALHLGQLDRERLVAQLEDAERVGQMGHVVWDHAEHAATVSAEARRQLGVDEEVVIRSEVIWSRVVPEDRERVRRLSAEAVAQGREVLAFDTRVSGPSAALRDLRVVQRFHYDGEGRVRRTLTTTQDITELKTTQRELHTLAFNDTLTGLVNRACFHQRLHERQVRAVLMLDLDHFKNVNDTLGHGCGDRLLVAVAHRLTTCLRAVDTVARLGGDEFAVLIHDDVTAAQLDRIAQRIVETLSAAYEIDQQEIVISASIGIAMVPVEGAAAPIDPDALMRQADTALFEAKARGRSRHQFHSEALTQRARERVALEADLRRALPERQFSLHYQPKVRLGDMHVVGAEALLRWQHPERGQVPPDRFIPVAEDTGLIVAIGAWVLREACARAAEWNRDRPSCGPMLRIAINLSPRQFLNHDLVHTVSSALADTGCRPEWIELEITERLLLDERGHAEETLNSLRALGLTLAIDDFGTGYSALGYLTRFPIGTLKIDKSFMRDITVRADRAGVVRAIISMGHSLQLGLVAEGVETEEQARFLREQGCELAQGWLYGRPMPAEAFGRLVSAGACSVDEVIVPV